MTISSKLLSSIPKVDWNLPANLSKELKSFININDDDDDISYNLILISLAHKSFISERESGKEKEFLFYLIELLAETGKGAVRLFSVSTIYNKNPDYTKEQLQKEKNIYINSISDHFTNVIINYSFLGKGEAQSESKNTKTYNKICDQVIGALFLSLGYNGIKHIFKNHYTQTVKNNLNSIVNPKSVLQEYTQKKWGIRPTYEIVKTTGLQHELEVFVKLTVQGKYCIAKDRSNKKAEAKSAMAFIHKYKIPHSIKKKQYEIKENKLYIIPHKHSFGIKELALKLGLSTNSELMLSQCLIHSSYCSDNIKYKKYCGCTGSLVQIGDAALPIIIIEKVLRYLLNNNYFKFNLPRLTTIIAMIYENLHEVGVILNLDNLILTGGTESTKANTENSIILHAIKSIFSTLLIDKQFSELGNILNSELNDWLNKKIKNILLNEKITFNSKGLLQENLLFLKVEWNYKINELSGPLHKANYISNLTMHSKLLNENFSCVGKFKKNTIKDADEDLAADLVEYINKIKEIIVENKFNFGKELIANSPPILRFFLRHIYSMLPEYYNDLVVWSGKK